MKVLIIHGWRGFEPEHWQNWLFGKLKEKKVEVYLPILPGFDNPKQKAWVKELEKFRPFDENTVMVGHSLGCAAILRLIEEMGEDESVGKTILVAGWIGKTPEYKEINDHLRDSRQGQCDPSLLFPLCQL